MSADRERPVFGRRLEGVTYEKRPAAYVIVRNDEGLVASVRSSSGYALPGGGSDTGETPEETVVREVREELGREVRIIEKIAEAVQYFHAASDETHYEMIATYFRAEFGETTGEPEYELCWLDMSGDGRVYFHECHDWAARRDGR